MNYIDRAKREKEQYNKGDIKRDSLNKYLSHSNKLLNKQIINDMKKYVVNGNGKNILEIGCTCWKGWIDKPGIIPSEMHCINVSDSELEAGSHLAVKSRVKPVFHLMDAHKLKFDDAYFDIIFGGAILHHLDVSIAMSEFSRVLKPGGLIIFAEPLDINPVSKIIRFFTPHTRTLDEQALRFNAFHTVSNYFDLSFTSYQLFSVPLSFISVFLFKNEINPVMRLAGFIDNNLQRIIPFLKYYYRYALIVGTKKFENGRIPERYQR